MPIADKITFGSAKMLPSNCSHFWWDSLRQASNESSVSPCFDPFWLWITILLLLLVSLAAIKTVGGSGKRVISLVNPTQSSTNNNWKHFHKGQKHAWVVQKHSNTPCKQCISGGTLEHHNESTYCNAQLGFRSWLHPASGGEGLRHWLRGMLENRLTGCRYQIRLQERRSKSPTQLW